jgi:hypothetical protein
MADRMGDSGEGLVDAASKIEERMEEIEESRRKEKERKANLDPDTVRAVESLRLARIDLERQLSSTVHDARRLYLQNVLAELDRRLVDLQTTA